MSAPPRADFVAGCRECGFSMEADSLDDVAWFYTCHHVAGHDVEWLWGIEMTLSVDPRVSEDGRVRNLSAVIGSLVPVFHPCTVPAEFLFERCLNAGAEKAAVEDQLDELPDSIVDRVDPLD